MKFHSLKFFTSLSKTQVRNDKIVENSKTAKVLQSVAQSFVKTFSISPFRKTQLGLKRTFSFLERSENQKREPLCEKKLPKNVARCQKKTLTGALWAMKLFLSKTKFFKSKIKYQTKPSGNPFSQFRK